MEPKSNRIFFKASHYNGSMLFFEEDEEEWVETQITIDTSKKKTVSREWIKNGKTIRDTYDNLLSDKDYAAILLFLRTKFRTLGDGAMGLDCSGWNISFVDLRTDKEYFYSTSDPIPNPYLDDFLRKITYF